MKKTPEIFIKKLVKRYMAHNISAVSAQIAYYWVLAFFPFLIFIITLLTYTRIPVDLFMKYVTDIAPNSVVPFIEGTINQFISYRSTTLLSAGVLVSLWSAGKAVNSLIKGIHLAYNSKYVRPFILARIGAIIYTVLLAVLIILMMVGLVFGNRVGNYIIAMLGINKGVYMPIWNLARLIMPIVALILILYTIYRFIPRKHLKSKNIWPGTFFTAIGWYVFSLIFSIYIDNYSKYNQLYGSIGSIFVLLIWLYSCCVLLLLGSEINAVYQEMKAEKVVRRISQI